MFLKFVTALRIAQKVLVVTLRIVVSVLTVISQISTESSEQATA